MTKTGYLLWALRKTLTGHATCACPSCGDPHPRLVRRKYAVTALRECPTCRLRFRTPKDDPGSTEDFYTGEVYKQGFTTDLPSDEQLHHLTATSFAGTEKDFSAKIDILRAAGLPAGARILDFGGSWGYASWQFRQAGFEVFTCEIGRQRAKYAEEKLGCTLVTDLRTLDGSIDCFFSSHVIEHLPRPNLLFDEAEKVLSPGGLFLCCCPNGAAEREAREGKAAYDRNWGAIHPLMITPTFAKRELAARNFAECNVYSSPVTRADVLAHRDGLLTGSELVFLARRRPASDQAGSR